MSHPATERLAAYALGLRLEAVPRDVIDHALLVIRDTLGAMLAGAMQPENAALADAAPRLGGPGAALVVGAGLRTAPAIAALSNGTAGVTLELDEGNQFAVNHPAVHVLPAALAAAEHSSRSGAELIAAFVAGYEVAVRVGRATRVREPVHPFGTTMIVGAAAAVARLRGLDVAATANAMRLAAGLSVASSQSAANHGASARNLATGLTGHNAVLATELAVLGHTGEPRALEAVFGRVLGDGFDAAGMAADLDEFFIVRNYFKLHACSRWNHAPIEAAAAAMAELDAAAEDVEQVVVWTFDPATRLSNSAPSNGYAAKHSIPYNVAVRLVRETNGLDAYTDEAVRDSQVRALAERVAVREDAALTALTPEVRAARVEVTLTDGRRHAVQVDRPPGGFDNPYDKAVLVDKFRSLAGRALPTTTVERLETTVGRLRELDELSELTTNLVARTGKAAGGDPLPQ